MQGETVIWYSTTTTEDDLGNSTPTEADGVELQALVAARSSSESTNPNEPALLVGKTLYLIDASIEPGPSDSFGIRGERYDVVGEPHRWGSMGVEVAVARAGGLP